MSTPSSHPGRFGPNFPGKRCGAKTRAGGKCLKPASLGTPRCITHGARGGAPRGEAHGMYKTGQHTIQAVAERRLKADAGRRSMKRVKLAIRMARLAGLFEGQKPRSSPVVVKKFYQLKAQYDALLDPPSVPTVE
jgi:hypothetical protein